MTPDPTPFRRRVKDPGLPLRITWRRAKLAWDHAPDLVHAFAIGTVLFFLSWAFLTLVLLL